MEYKNRKETPKAYKWDLTAYYKDDKEWEKDYLKIIKEFENIKSYEGKVTKSANMLYQTLEEYFAYESRLTKLFVYASLRHDEALEDADASMLYNKIYKTYNDFCAASSFIEPEIIKEETSKVEKLLETKKLNKYKFYVTNILREKEHMLSSSEEKLIAKLTSTNHTFKNVNMTLLNSTLNYGEVKSEKETRKITNSNYHIIMESTDRNIRRDAYEKLTSKIAEFKNIFAENLVSNMKNTSSMAEIRKFPSTLDSLLFSSNIPNSVVDSLYKVINKNLNVYQKYLKLIKNSLGLKELAYYDLNAQILTDEMSFSIEDAQYLIGEATKIYGEEYHDIIEKAFNEKWVDYCSYKGKASGAYCTSCYGAHPVVLTNFFGKFGDVSAVAHELGHAVNFYLSQQANNKHDYNNDIFVAEVASLTNEIILSNYVIEHSRNKNLKLIALYNLINLIQNNLFDACLEGELENKAYTLIDNGETIDAEYLSSTIYDIRSKYYKDVVNLDDKSKYSWIRREHYFYPFYLFKYATGVSAAIMIASKIINNEDDMKNKYISFLKMGDTDYPVELLKKIGIDMTKEEVYENAVNFFSNLIDEFDKESDK